MSLFLDGISIDWKKKKNWNMSIFTEVTMTNMDGDPTVYK